MQATPTGDTSPVSFGFNDTRIPVEVWTQSGGNRFALQGNLTYNGQPVAGARLRTNIYKLPGATGDDGSFELKGDKTILQRQVLTADDLSAATIGGAPLDTAATSALHDASVVVESIFELSVEPTSVTANTADAKLSGTMTFKDGSLPVPQVQLWGYVLSGIVMDANGRPLADANVSIRDDEGETWSLSTLTDETGEYMLRFYPLGGDFQVRVSQAAATFESDVLVTFNSETSAQMDIVVHNDMDMAMGTGTNGAWEITDVPGAEYVGFLASVAEGDKPLQNAVTTLPDDSGTFTVTLPALPAGKRVTFFQERFRVFAHEPLLPGNVVPAELIPARIPEEIPMEIEPAITIG